MLIEVKVKVARVIDSKIRKRTETYLLEKVNTMRYDNNHNVVEENVSVLKYDVNASDIFKSTIYDRMHSAENRINVEIIADYNTENEKKYNLFATTDSILYAAVLNDVTYLTYSDPECQNPVNDLSMYEGLKSVTLYATELVFDDEVRYTVTEEEWNAWTTHKNYTIEQYYGDIDHFVIKYTDNAIEFEKGQIILFEGDKQYSIRETENGYVAMLQKLSLLRVNCLAVDTFMTSLFTMKSFAPMFLIS